MENNEEASGMDISSYLDNNVQMPNNITLGTFAAARANEIQMLRKAISQTSGTKLAFQKLPMHMRRRAMSHNVKRLPRRIRKIHQQQMAKSGENGKQKRPTRKYRRKPYNLLSERERRQRRIAWLETHIWHAKRFKMIEKWGYKLPFCPNDKSFRACYRATTKHCLIQDISYYSCVEIKGNSEIIINTMKEITDQKPGFGINAKAFKSGFREGSVTMFSKEETCKKYIGQVNFLWKPESGKKRFLWLWIHPSFYKEALENLIVAFNFVKNTNAENSFINSDNIEMMELKNGLNRFRLFGPLSTSVIAEALKTVSPNEDPSNEFISDYSDIIEAQTNFWNEIRNISDPSELPPNSVISLFVYDPRFSIPSKRCKAVPDLNKKIVDKIPDEISKSILWKQKVRSTISSSKISTSEVNRLRSQLLVPGSDLKEKGAVVPIILIQRPGNRSSNNLGYGSGWDVILPGNWAQPFWMAFIFQGARAGGLRETESVAFEAGCLELLQPDTKTGQLEESLLSFEAKEIYFRKPPNKRQNYNKLRIASPFKLNWQLLLKEWGNTSLEFEVLRDQSKLERLERYLNGSEDKFIENCENCLVQVKVVLDKKGACLEFATICLPRQKDLSSTTFEKQGDDENYSKRKELRKEHKKLLKRLRNRRIRKRKKGENVERDIKVMKNYKETMRKLWLPEPETIRNSCSREVIGFVKKGGFNYLLGGAAGVGYIAVPGLKQLSKLSCRNKILIRNTNSLQYRLATLQIIV